jgi:hypothetical protein
MDGKMSTPKNKIKGIEKRADLGTKHAEKKHDFITIGESEWIDINKINLNEDLGVWFGTKKKPKGSKQPKGPWVNICRKKEGGGHPPCGRPDADSKGYPKCRAAGVAAKMSDSEKKSACQQKRTAEKKDTQTGKGQKPVMTSYKPKNESVMSKIIKLTESDLMRIVKKVLNEQKAPIGKKINLFCQNDVLHNGSGSSFREHNLTLDREEDMRGGISGGGFKRLYLTPDSNIPRETYDSDEITLDIIPSDRMNKSFLEKSKMDDELGQTIYFIGYKTGAPYFCSPDAGTDKDWESYLNTF